MSLEDTQRLHHQLQARKNNISGSNDPHQLQHDSNERLIRGAEFAAAADVLGLDDEETIQLLMRQQDKYSRRQLRDVDGSEVYRGNADSIPAVIRDTSVYDNDSVVLGQVRDSVDTSMMFDGVYEDNSSDTADASKQFQRKIDKYRQLRSTKDVERAGKNEKGFPYSAASEERNDFGLTNSNFSVYGIDNAGVDDENVVRTRIPGPGGRLSERKVDEFGNVIDDDALDRAGIQRFLRNDDGSVVRDSAGNFVQYIDTGSAQSKYLRSGDDGSIVKDSFGQKILIPGADVQTIGFAPQNVANANSAVNQIAADRAQAARAVAIDNFLGRSNPQARAYHDARFGVLGELMRRTGANDPAVQSAFAKINLTADGKESAPRPYELPQATYISGKGANAYYGVGRESLQRLIFPDVAQNSNYTDELQNLNVPTQAPPTDPKHWAVAGLQQFQEAPLTSGLPQADITGMTTLAADKLRALEKRMKTSFAGVPAEGPLTGLANLEGVAEQVFAKDGGKKFVGGKAGEKVDAGLTDALLKAGMNYSEVNELAAALAMKEAATNMGMKGEQVRTNRVRPHIVNADGTLGGLINQAVEVRRENERIERANGIMAGGLGRSGFTGGPIGGQLGSLRGREPITIVDPVSGEARRSYLRTAYRDEMPARLSVMDQDQSRARTEVLYDINSGTFNEKSISGASRDSTSPVIGVPQGESEQPVARNYGNQSRAEQRDYFVREQGRRSAMRAAGRKARPFKTQEMSDQMAITEGLVSQTNALDAEIQARNTSLAAEQVKSDRPKAGISEEMQNRNRIQGERQEFERSEARRLMTEGSSASAPRDVSPMDGSYRELAALEKGQRAVTPQFGESLTPGLTRVKAGVFRRSEPKSNTSTPVQKGSIPRKSPIVSDPWEGGIEYTRPVSPAATQQTRRVLALPPGQPPTPPVQQAAAAGSEPPRRPQGSATQRHLPRFGNRSRLAGGLLAAAGTGAGLSYLANRNEREEERI